MTDQNIEKLVRTVGELAISSKKDWVPWCSIAKKLEGSEQFSQLFKSIADLPAAKSLFAKNENTVKLTEDGWVCFRGLPRSSIHVKPLPIQISNAVKEYASTLKPLRFRVESVGRGQRIGKRIVQPIFIDTEETFATDTPVTFCSLSNWKNQGKVVGQEPDGTAVYIAFPKDILPDSLPGWLEVDRAFLLHSLAERLAALEELPELVTKLLGGCNETRTISLGDCDAVTVADRLSSLRTPWARFLWGPPGSGKTYGIGRLLAQLLRRSSSDRHLIVAPSNRAVDVAVMQFLLHCREQQELRQLIADRRVLRFGYPRKTEVMDLPELLGPVKLDGLTSAIKAKSRQLRDSERSQVSEESLAVIRAELLTLQEELRDIVREHIEQCIAVFTSSTLAYLGSESNPISEMEWASVLVDEATMVPPAQCVFLGSLAQSRFLLGGDPRQLGPVFESHGAEASVFEWMGRDIFEKSNISRGAGENRELLLSDGRMVRIEAQRRCSAGIWRQVQRLYPHVSCSVDESSLKWLRDLPPTPGQSVVVLDISTLGKIGSAHCRKIHESWVNECSAALAMEVACAAIGSAEKGLSIAIITPYRAQVKLLRKWLRGEGRSENPAYRTIEAGTVHQFQGSDADFVIFDLVDGRGRKNLGALLRDDTGLRLVTVAITRARGKVVLIADREWFGSSVRREQNPLLWDLIIEMSEAKQLRVAAPVHPSEDGIACESLIEVSLLQAMRTQQSLSTVQPQYRIRDDKGTIISRADFAFPEIKYAVYCDGAEWHLRRDRWQMDWRQRNRLTEIGWIFSVFTGTEVKRNSTECASQVARTYQERKGLLDTPPKT